MPKLSTDPALPVPSRMARLDVNRAGYVVPWFVDRDCDVDGQPDFRIMDIRKLNDAIRFTLCWVCGQRRGRYGTFVIGPMCAINRTSAEPPCHADCAEYSARVCPFLSTPKMTRRDKHMPEDKVAPAGVMLLRNPGVTLLWTSTKFSTYKVGNGVLFDIGEPVLTQWFAQGREATAAEIMASIDSGLPLLREPAEKEGPRAVAELDRRYAEVATMVRS